MIHRTAVALVGVVLAISQVQAQEGGQIHLRVDAAGKTVSIDLAVLKDFCEKPPADAAGFKVQYGGADAEIKDWKAEVAGAKPEGEIVITCDDPAVKLSIKLSVADKRRAESGGANLFGQDAAWGSVCDTGDGKWKTKSNDPRYEMSTDGAQPTLDGIEVGSWTPLAKAGGSSLYLVPAKKLTASTEIAQKCLDAILKEDWATYVSCFTKDKQQKADQNDACKMYWRAHRAIIEKKNNEVAKIVYAGLRKSGTGGPNKALFFKYFNDDNEQVGYDKLVTLVLEDGKWVVDQVMQ